MNRVITGDALAALRTLESENANTCVTSPPYYGLRDYGIKGQIGLEETVGEYIDKLVLVFREVRRVLRRDGTLWLNVGDSYATRSGPQAPANTRNRHGHTSKRVPDGYKYKELMGIPWLLAFALRGDGWYLRDDIIWHKTNAMPEAVTDRPTRAHEYLFLLSKAPRYYYDAKAIEEPCGSKGNARSFRGGGAYTGHASFDNDAAAVRATHGNAGPQSGVYGALKEADTKGGGSGHPAQNPAYGDSRGVLNLFFLW
ncbi:MAG: site-specific DNA-methyltransferase [Intestinimonas sp.]|nr:site-specific DNA-methyltransferase [Intestinimonas sp.]